MGLEKQIKEYALELGFCKCGMTSVEKLGRVLPEAVLRGEYDYWLEKFEKGIDPREIYPDGRSVIVLAYDYGECDFPEKLLPMVGRAYLSRSYLPQPGSAVYQKLKKFEDFLCRNSLEFMSDSNLLLMRPAAERAGVASFGQNNFAYVDGVGSFVILYGYIVNQKLEYDEPYTESKCPPGCRACVNACPTKALYAPFKLSPTKCIGFNNWMRQEGKFSDIIPREIRAQMGCHIHGCDMCQAACPRNRAKLKGVYPKDPLLESIAENFSLPGLLHMSDGFYEKYVHPIMYNYIKEKKYFQRNAAVAMGNTGNREYIPDLVQELENPDEVIRIHVVWALGVMKDEAAREALLKHKETETSNAVLEEIDFALDN